MARIAGLPEYGWRVTATARRSSGTKTFKEACNWSVCSEEDQRALGLLPEQMMEEMSRSAFCLLPGGDTPDMQRLAIAVAVNCIPVIIARFYGGPEVERQARNRAEYIEEYERRGGRAEGDEREDFWFFAPFSDIVDYSSFAVLVDPVEFVHRPVDWLPARLAAIAANATLMDSMLLSLAREGRHLVFDEAGSDVGDAALLSAARHCLSRPTVRLPTEAERRKAMAAGVAYKPAALEALLDRSGGGEGA